jgi:SAM-dependent methyltransferase
MARLTVDPAHRYFCTVGEGGGVTRSSWQEQYLRRFYDRERGWEDGTQLFHRLCRSAIPAGGTILELGAGPENPTSTFLAGLGSLHGLDPDPAVLGNSALASARVLDGPSFPYDDGSFDACVSNYVVEHVADPRLHLREVGRVLRPGGAYVLRTPNLFHYVTMASALTPHWVHLKVANRLRGYSSESHDPYPTVYRMNTRRHLRRLSRESGLVVDRLDLIEREPIYGLSSRALFLLFLGYERVVNSTDLLAGLRANLFAVLRRPV